MKQDCFLFSLHIHLVTSDCLNNCVVPWIRDVLQEVVKWPFSSHIVLNHKPQECQHCQSPISELLLFGLLSGSKVEGVKNATRVATLIGRQAIALEDRILIDTSRVLDVLPPSDLHVVKQDELDHEKCR